MYSNVFDTFAMEDELQRAINTANMQGMFYTSIISGLHPTLSLNQVVDSPSLHDIMASEDHTDFFKLIENKTIRVARFRKISNAYPDAIDEYIIPKLQGSLYCEFSSLPFLNKSHEKYNEAQKAKILEELLLSYTSTDLPSSRAFKTPDKDDAHQLFRWVMNLKNLKNAINRNYLPYIKTELPDLSAMVTNALEASANDPDTAFCRDELNEFKAYLESLIEKAATLSDAEKNSFEHKLNSRSGMYNFIRDLGCESSAAHELKSIVDLKYNERVAKSIDDNEDDVIVNNFGDRCTEILLDSEEHSTKDEQRLYIVQNALEQDHEYITWALLNDILDAANSKYKNANDLNKWHEIMDDTLRKRGIKSIIQKENNLILGDIHFILSSASTLYSIINKDPVGITLSGLTLAANAAKMVYSRHQAKKALESDTLKGYTQAHKLLTQASYLKHDYSDPY